MAFQIDPAYHRLDPSTSSAVKYAECSILSAIFLWPDQHVKLFTGLEPVMFSTEERETIYRIALELHEAGYTPDYASIMERVERQGLSRYVGLRGYATFPPPYEYGHQTPSHIESWKKVVIDRYRIWSFKVQVRTMKCVEDVTRTAQEIIRLVQRDNRVETETWDDACDAFLAHQQGILEGSISTGTTWGVRAIDEFTLLRPGYLYVVAGLKKCGKSLLVQRALFENALKENPVLFFSMEMTRQDVIRRWVSCGTEINSRKLLSRSLTPEEFEAAKASVALIKTLPFRVNQSPSLSISEVIAESRLWKQELDIPDGQGIVAVDFLQLMTTGDAQKRTEASQLKDMAYDLARLAKEIRMPVVAVCQFNNEAERYDHAELRFIEGSGAIAQAAEAILLLHMPSRSGGDDSSGPKSLDLTLYQRNGESGRKFTVTADMAVGRFT